MLASELYQANKDSEVQPSSSTFILKKIFLKNGKPIIDKKTIEGYGSTTNKDTAYVQNLLQMPLNTINAADLNLPTHQTGSNSAKPYIMVYGTFKTNQKLVTRLEIEISGMSKTSISYKFDLSDQEMEKEFKGQVKLNLDRKNYFTGSKTLFSEYVKSRIIDEEGILNSEVYESIIKSFLIFVKKQKPEFVTRNITTFRLYILPNDSTITYQQSEKKSNLAFTDYFGNDATEFPSEPTLYAKFLTSDDPAFVINCSKNKKEFYKNLGIGDKSFEKIYVDQAKTFTIARLKWTFFDQDNIHHTFTETKKGILSQIYENYNSLLNGKGTSEKTRLKVICIKKDNAKQEILIDENLTMGRMEKLCAGIKDSPPLCLEIFIEKYGQSTMWDTYVHIVKNVLAGRPISRRYMLSYFERTLKRNQFEWKKSKYDKDARDFFSKSVFCLTTLLNADETTTAMRQESETFAESIGRISRAFIDFKKEHGERDNSFEDILTYSKYDREKLRFILARIGRGVALSKTALEKKDKLNDKIATLRSSKEISDDLAMIDLSYFFFKGYYMPEAKA